MGNTLSQYRMAIGLFNCNYITCECTCSSILTLLIVLWYLILLMAHFIMSNAANVGMAEDELLTSQYRPGLIICCTYICSCKILLFSVLLDKRIVDKYSIIINRKSVTNYLHHCILTLLLWNYVNIYYFDEIIWI